MPFWGREREIAAITAALEKKKNVILTGKYGIGKTTLVKEAAKINCERWHFLFADFSEPPSKVCHDLLPALKPRKPSEKRTRCLGYKQSRSLIADLTTKTKRRCVIVLDNIEKLTHQRLDLVRYLAWDKPFRFVAIPEHFLPEDDLSRLRACLYPSRLIRLNYLSAKQTERFFRDCAVKHQFQWTESDIRVLSLSTKGYPLAMRESVTRELERQKER
jgi:energy-coupling factor transporter ATP-binding protein EcfA2